MFVGLVSFLVLLLISRGLDSFLLTLVQIGLTALPNSGGGGLELHLFISTVSFEANMSQYQDI